MLVANKRRFLQQSAFALGLLACGRLASPALANAPARLGPVLSVQQLAELKSAVKVLDIREPVEGEKKVPTYSAGHIPGALSAPYSAFRGPKDNPGALISDAKLSEVVQRLGLQTQDPIVVVHSGRDATEFGAAARVYWTLKVAGFKQLSILDGGLKAWVDAKQPLSAEEVKATPSQTSVKIDRSQVVTTEEVKALVSAPDGAGAQTRLIDGRPSKFFEGDVKHAAAQRWGTIPKAEHFDQERWFRPKSSQLLPAAELSAVAQSAGLITKDPTVSFCNTGHWAATNWFVLSELLGQSGVKLYPESIVAYSKAGLPLANEPSRATILWRQLRESTGI